MTKKMLLLFCLIFYMFACKEKEPEEPIVVVPPIVEKPPCLTCNYEEESPIGCLTCDKDTISEIYKDVDARVVGAGHDLINGLGGSLVFNIQKAQLNETSYTFSKDSLLVPCKKIPIGYDTIGQRVKISGKLMSCRELLSCPRCNFLFFGRKFILTQIR
jgi:hypothetical protein